jgi:D-inositol-3-phosphate glycosyltransferase
VQWAKVLTELLRTPALVARLAAGTRQHAERFSWERTADHLAEAYGEAADEMEVRRT